MKYKNNLNGFTLVEVVVTIAVVAILAAIMVPMISNNIKSAKFAKARADVDAIKDAIIKFRQDLGIWPVYNAANNKHDLLFGEGSIVSTWDAAASQLSLRYNLIDNTKPYTPGPSKDGTPAWNGPYIGELKTDPWGNAYLVNAMAFDIVDSRVWVLCAGLDKVVSAPLSGNFDPPGGDDIYEYLK